MTKRGTPAMTIEATVTIDLTLEIRGQRRRAEPDVGIFSDWFEDVEAFINGEPVSEAFMKHLRDKHEDDMQDALLLSSYAERTQEWEYDDD